MYNTMLSTQHLKGMGADPLTEFWGFMSDVGSQAASELQAQLPEALKQEALATMFPKQYKSPTTATTTRPSVTPQTMIPQTSQPMTVTIPQGAVTPTGYVNVGGTGIKTNVLLLGGAAVAALLLIILLKK